MPFFTVLLTFVLQSFVIVDSTMHDESRFTQGLSFHEGLLVESTGRYGSSGIYFYDKNFKTIDSLRLDAKYFGEGSQILENDIFYLTWKSGNVFKYDKRSLRLLEVYHIPTEGWGLSFYNGEFLLSDGSNEIFRVRPDDFKIVGSFKVYDEKTPVRNLNELEVIGDTLYANIWQRDSIVAIDLKKETQGNVLFYMDFSLIAKNVRKKSRNAETLNGIAYDGKALFITGKLWPVIYKVQLK